jgi:hypothetical protein
MNRRRFLTSIAAGFAALSLPRRAVPMLAARYTVSTYAMRMEVSEEAFERPGVCYVGSGPGATHATLNAALHDVAVGGIVFLLPGVHIQAQELPITITSPMTICGLNSRGEPDAVLG